MKIDGDKLNFLEVTPIKNNNIIEFDWFHKLFLGGTLILLRNILFLKKEKLVMDISYGLLVLNISCNLIMILIRIMLIF